MDKKIFRYLISITATITMVFIVSCSGKKTRMWITPPYSASEKDLARNINFQVEDVQTGKKESLTIPLHHSPETLVVENMQKKDPNDKDLAVTFADRIISEGKVKSSDQKGPLSLSYLNGTAEVEDLYTKEKYSEALIRLAPLVEQYPKQAKLFIMQGTLYRKIGEKKLALGSFKRAQKLDKSNADLEEAILAIENDLGENL